MPQSKTRILRTGLNQSVQHLMSKFDGITPERKYILKQLTEFVESKINAHQKARLNFICTHNSRRSHISQIWAQTAAYLYEISDVECFSGGTEATAFNPRAVTALKDIGFEITMDKSGDNPVYEVSFAKKAPSIVSFSKKYDDPFNQNEDFAAIMTCSHADENCPFIPGASERIALTYDDPKEFDGTSSEAAGYKERSLQIGCEILYAFSQVNNGEN